MLGVVPRVPGVVPRVLGVVPRVLGVVPRVLGVVPRVLGVLRRVLGVSVCHDVMATHSTQWQTPLLNLGILPSIRSPLAGWVQPLGC